MFNPKQALQRIRRTKNQKQEVKSITEGVQPLFTSAEPDQRKPSNSNSNSIEDRVGKLELMVLRLTEQLTNSNESVEKLKRENSNLETQILKLQYENSQLKSKEAYSTIRRNGSNKRIVEPISEQPEKYQSNREAEKVRKLDSHLVQREVYSVEVENCIEEIKNQPIENVLKRRENQFRARKPDSKQSQAGNKYLKELAALEKEYSRTMKKPVLVIKLDDIDFQ